MTIGLTQRSLRRIRGDSVGSHGFANELVAAHELPCWLEWSAASRCTLRGSIGGDCGTTLLAALRVTSAVSTNSILGNRIRCTMSGQVNRFAVERPARRQRLVRMSAEILEHPEKLARIPRLQYERALAADRVCLAGAAGAGDSASSHGLESHEAEGLMSAICQHSTRAPEQHAAAFEVDV